MRQRVKPGSSYKEREEALISALMILQLMVPSPVYSAHL